MLNILKKEILSNAKEYCESNWDEICETVQQSMKLYDRAIREGILSLEDDADDLEPKYLRDFLRLIIDGQQKDFIEDLMVNYFYANNISGIDAYLFLINCTMVLSLAECDKRIFEININSLVIEKKTSELINL